MNTKEFLLSLAEYVMYYVIFYYLRLPVHEWNHLWTLQYLGGDGYIISTFYGAATVLTKSPTHPTIVAFAGGLGLGMLMLILMYWDWIGYDMEQFSALMPHAFSELAYGVFEGLYIPAIGFWGQKLTTQQFIQYSQIIAFVAWLIGLLIGMYYWFKWAKWLATALDERATNMLASP